MGPFRLAIIAGLVYLIYKMLTRPDKGHNQAHSVNGQDKVPDDLLVEDPVCHTYVPQKNSESFKLHGETHYFCSQECLQKFKENNKGA
jgi:YHS domain-containing protein